MVSIKAVKNKKEDKNSGRKKGKDFFRQLLLQKELVLMIAPFVILVLIFNYYPIWGWLMAFQDYKPHLGVLGSDWIGLENFRRLFSYQGFYNGLRNTLAISTLKYIFNFLTTITLAILLNEIKNLLFKRTVQTISYLPHFVSWVVAANIVLTSLSPDGIINKALVAGGILNSPELFIAKKEYFWVIVAASEVWKEVGWGAIIYLAAISGIDPQLYEAVSIDGGGRFRKIFHITLPGIAPIVKILMILSAGAVLNAGMEQVLLLSNPAVAEVSETLELFILKFGIKQRRYSFATAAGIFNTSVSMILLFTANKLSEKFTGERAF